MVKYHRMTHSKQVLAREEQRFKYTIKSEEARKEGLKAKLDLDKIYKNLIWDNVESKRVSSKRQLLWP